MNIQLSTEQVKKLLIDTFALPYQVSEIQDETAVVGEGLELDSVDVLEIIVQFEKKYNLKLRDQQFKPTDFKTVRSITELANRAV